MGHVLVDVIHDRSLRKSILLTDQTPGYLIPSVPLFHLEPFITPRFSHPAVHTMKVKHGYMCPPCGELFIGTKGILLYNTIKYSCATYLSSSLTLRENSCIRVKSECSYFLRLIGGTLSLHSVGCSKLEDVILANPVLSG